MSRRAYQAGWLAYSMVIVCVTTLPFQFTMDAQIVQMKLAHVSPNPLFDPWRAAAASPGGWLMNIAFFVPFGTFGILARTVPGLSRRALLMVTLLGLLLSFAVETLQVFTRSRIPSMGDLAANTIGTLAGALVTYVVRLRQERVGG